MEEVETVFDSLEVQVILEIITIPDAEEVLMSSSRGRFQALIMIVSLLFKLVSWETGSNLFLFRFLVQMCVLGVGKCTTRCLIAVK